MGSAESRPRENKPPAMSVRRTSACSRASVNGGASSSCCRNHHRHHNRSRRERTNKPCCSRQPTNSPPTCCLPYPEFTLSTSGICYIQCGFCCQIYPDCCPECPNCGGKRAKTSPVVELPETAFCPCCRQESPKANGLQNLCKPKPGCMCQCTCAERERIAKCLLRSYKQTRGKRGKRCCKCQPQQQAEGNKRTNVRKKTERFHYPAYQSARLCTCESDAAAANNSRPQRAEKCCCERSRATDRPYAKCSSANYRRTPRESSQRTRAQCCKAERQRSVESGAGSSRRRRHSYGNNPSVMRAPCGCEVEIKNITYDLPVCRLDDKDDAGRCCRCNKKA